MSDADPVFYTHKTHISGESVDFHLDRPQQYSQNGKHRIPDRKSYYGKSAAFERERGLCTWEIDVVPCFGGAHA